MTTYKYSDTGSTQILDGDQQITYCVRRACDCRSGVLPEVLCHPDHCQCQSEGDEAQHELATDAETGTVAAVAEMMTRWPERRLYVLDDSGHADTFWGCTLEARDDDAE